MRSNTSMKRDHGSQASGLLKYAAIGGLLFLHFPILFIFLYAFTSESKSYQFPPPGITLKWFEVTYLFTRTGLTASVLPGWDNLSSRCTP